MSAQLSLSEASSRQLLELEVLESIYATNFECSLPTLATLRRRADASDASAAAAAAAADALTRCRLTLDGLGDPCGGGDTPTTSTSVTLHFTLPPLYPAVAPAIAVSSTSPALNAAATQTLGAALNDIARSLTLDRAEADGGQECLFEVASECGTLVADLLERQAKEAAAAAAAGGRGRGSGGSSGSGSENGSGSGTRNDAALKFSQVLLFIDHMNDFVSYLKKVTGWVNELQLTGLLLHRMRVRSIQAVSGGNKVTPRGRAEDIFLWLEGPEENTRAFLSRLRTSKMTSQDRHERKSTVLWSRSLVEADRHAVGVGGDGGGGGGSGGGGSVGGVGGSGSGGGSDAGGGGGGSSDSLLGLASHGSEGESKSRGGKASATTPSATDPPPPSSSNESSPSTKGASPPSPLFTGFAASLYTSKVELEAMWGQSRIATLVALGDHFKLAAGR